MIYEPEPQNFVIAHVWHLNEMKPYSENCYQVLFISNYTYFAIFLWLAFI